MKKGSLIAAALMCMALMMAGCATCTTTQETKKTTPAGIVRGDMTVITATVVAVDLEKRIVTLKDAEGEVRDFRVGEEAVNLPQVRAGDIVKVTFYESIAVEVIKPGTAAASGESTAIVRAKPGELPGGMVTRQQTVTATVKAIDRAAGTISLMGPNGRTVKVKVAEPANLEKVKVGDDLLITFTEAEAISVVRPQ